MKKKKKTNEGRAEDRTKGGDGDKQDIYKVEGDGEQRITENGEIVKR